MTEVGPFVHGRLLVSIGCSSLGQDSYGGDAVSVLLGYPRRVVVELGNEKGVGVVRDGDHSSTTLDTLRVVLFFEEEGEGNLYFLKQDPWLTEVKRRTIERFISSDLLVPPR